MKRSINQEAIIFRKLVRKDVANLIVAGFQNQFGKSMVNKIVNQSFLIKIKQKTKILPSEIWLVAVHVQENRAIGTLQLVKYNKQLYSIKFVFTDPTQRKKGVATGLIKFAFSQAKKMGAKKIYLNVEPEDIPTIKLYEKLGFQKIINSSVVWGEGYLSNFDLIKNNELNYKSMKSKKTRNILFSIYKSCIDNYWFDFFELTKKNMTKGFQQNYRFPYRKKTLANKSKQYLILVFKLPFSHIANVEAYCSSKSNISLMLEMIFDKLKRKSITYSKITLFNINNGESLQILEENEFHPYQSFIMGKIL